MGQVTFWYTVNKVKPAVIVDKCIEFVLDLMIPGRGAGESNWMMRGYRSLEQGAERAQREVDIRTELRQWDNEFPQIHHELIVRWICGAIASAVITSIYNSLKPQPRARK